MKKEFFNTLEKILYNQNLNQKINDFYNFYDDFKSKKIIFDHSNISVLKECNYEKVKFIHPTRIRRPKFTKSIKSLAQIIHSIAHIEFSAINLALDSAYRFKNLPLNFYQDWLEVADEEIKHFQFLNQALEQLGYKYGDFFVHDNLDLALKLTKDSLASRMGVVHRGLEAKGLDANPFVLKKIQTSDNEIKSFLEEILYIILKDEITHVSKGDFWWKFSKDKKENFLSLCKEFKTFSLAGKQLNFEARIQAGFDPLELQEIDKFYNN